MTVPFHSGELEVQRRAGVESVAAKLARTIHGSLPKSAQDFLPARTFLVAGSAGGDGRVYASLLSGLPGFARARDDTTVEIDASSVADVALLDRIAGTPQLALLAIDLETRRRMRVNGLARLDADGVLRIRVGEAFSNCPRYIQRREPMHNGAPAESARPAPQVAVRSGRLSDAHARLLQGSDTFFVASHHPERGADVSHRGGRPGFLRVLGPSLLAWPDYSGNGMFQTLGNIAAKPEVGLLVVDWERGGTLALTGSARVDWDEARAAEFAGAERVVEVELDEIVEMEHATRHRMRFVEASPVNP